MHSKIIVFIMTMLWMSHYSIQCQTLYLSTEGSTQTDDQILDSLYYQKSFKEYSSLQSEVASIKNNLIKLGFIETELIYLKKQNDTTYLASFDLKKRYKSIRLYFDNTVNRTILKLGSSDIYENQIDINIEKLEETLKLYNFEIANLGDPFSTLQLGNISKTEDGQLRADLNVTQTIQKRAIDSIIINGYENFPKSFIQHYLKIKRQQPFNLKIIKDKMSELGNLTFANQIKDPEVLFTKDSTLLYIYLEKQKSNTFDGFLGFGTNNETNKIEFDGYLNLNLINNLNYGESFKLLYKSDENEQKTFDVKIRLPYLFGSPLGFGFGLNIFKKDSTFVTAAQSAKLDYQVNSRNLVALGINFTTSTNLLDASSLFLDDYKSQFYTFNYLYFERQRYNLLFPTNFQFDLSLGLGHRINQDIRESQTQFSLNSFKIFNLNDKNSIFLGLAGAVLTSDRYFDNELFRFGGINSIRGFEENSLSANLFSVLNTEYRYKVSNSLYVHSVLDAAYFENSIVDIKEKLFGFGFGFGLITKAGLFKFNYSSGKTENKSFKFSDSKIHLSLTASF